MPEISRWTRTNTHTAYIHTSSHQSQKGMQKVDAKWMQKVDAKGGCKKQISISIKDKCMYICCVCVFVLVHLDISGILSPIEEFEVNMEISVKKESGF